MTEDRVLLIRWISHRRMMLDLLWDGRGETEVTEMPVKRYRDRI